MNTRNENTDHESLNDRPSLLLVDDDETFCYVLSKALGKRDFDVTIANHVDDASQLAEKNLPEFAVIDLNMPGPSGLVLVERLKALDTHTRIVVLTGYASIATAVEAIKLGATHYLSKPADADDVVAAFYKEEGDSNTPVTSKPMSVNRVEWEHIQKVLINCNGNISAAARQLNMHRRTLQRKLQKRPMKS
ncbi:Dna binding response regulator PrrA (RegA) [hydrothermal vent metagenome]|uniref:Dna binding response regulator PrrA (RegA) n=1 Tax=hydrothermal vent metagenome TaxID=652676 RepID=A0A3B0Z9F8_9ZZZZ